MHARQDGARERGIAEGVMEVVRVLIIESNTALQESTRWLLEDAGHEVMTVGTARAGLRILTDTPGRWVVLLDHYVPRTDGLAVLRRVEVEPALQRHAYIIVTTQPERYSVEERAALSRLQVPIVAKPYDLDDVLTAVAQAARGITGESE